MPVASHSLSLASQTPELMHKHVREDGASMQVSQGTTFRAQCRPSPAGRKKRNLPHGAAMEGGDNLGKSHNVQSQGDWRK